MTFYIDLLTDLLLIYLDKNTWASSSYQIAKHANLQLWAFCSFSAIMWRKQDSHPLTHTPS